MLSLNLKPVILLWKKVIYRFKPYLGRTLFYILLCVGAAVITTLSAHARSEFVNLFLEEYPSNQRIYKLLMLNLFIMFLSRYGLPMLQELVAEVISAGIIYDVEAEIGKKKCFVPWLAHEDQNINDKMELVEGSAAQVWIFFKEMVSIISTVISTFGMFFIMLQLGKMYVFFLFLLFIPVTYFSVIAASSYYDTWRRTAQLRRYCNYERNVMMEKQYATERILFEYTPFFLKSWMKNYEKVRTLSIKEEVKGARKMQLGGILFCGYIAALISVITYKLARNQITLGVAVSLISIFPSVMNKMIITISNGMNQLVKAGHSINALVEFENIKNEENAFQLPVQGISFRKIEFCNVSFQYPGTSKWVLKNVNMCFEAGKHYAIVGENGAGKSTLIKLMLRLYSVTEGQILIDGKDIKDFSGGEIRGLMTALFQDFQHYYMSISENIGIGDIHHIHDMPRIMKSAREANIHEKITYLPDGYETILGTMQNNGIDISGGEWQKLAISRLLMSPCQIKILDEPTAAMDAIFEYELYQDFKRVMEGKTTVSISHRLASCRNADYIYVLAQGRVEEEGSHERLMSNHGLYSKMYITQREMYK